MQKFLLLRQSGALNTLVDVGINNLYKQKGHIFGIYRDYYKYYSLECVVYSDILALN